MPFISIDFWNTIVIAKSNGEQRHQARLDALHRLATRQNKQITNKQIQEANARASQHFDEVWLGTQRTPDAAELVAHTLRHLGLEANARTLQQVTQIYEDSLLDGPPELAPGVAEALGALCQKFELGIISDTMFSPGRVLRNHLKQKGIHRFFSSFAFSNEVGVSKPHPAMFEKVLNETGGEKQGSWHIGDMQPTDIKGAQAYGIKGLLYTGVSDAFAHDTTADLVCDSWEEIARRLL